MLDIFSVPSQRSCSPLCFGPGASTWTRCGSGTPTKTQRRTAKTSISYWHLREQNLLRWKEEELLLLHHHQKQPPGCNISEALFALFRVEVCEFVLFPLHARMPAHGAVSLAPEAAAARAAKAAEAPASAATTAAGAEDRDARDSDGPVQSSFSAKPSISKLQKRKRHHDLKIHLGPMNRSASEQTFETSVAVAYHS